MKAWWRIQITILKRRRFRSMNKVIWYLKRKTEAIKRRTNIVEIRVDSTKQWA